MKKFLGALAGLVAVLALAVFLLPFLIPQSVLEQQLRPLLAKDTGLQLEEAQRLRLALFPEFAVIVDGVSASLPADAQRRPTISADRISAALRPSALFQGRLELQGLTFEKPTLIIDRPRGQVLGPSDPWLQKVSDQIGGQPLDGRLLRIADKRAKGRHRGLFLPALNIGIVDGSLVLRARGDRRTVMISNANLAFTSPGGSAPVALEGELHLKDQPVNIRAVATPSGADAAIRIAINSAAMRTDIDGSLALAGDPRFKGALRSELTSGEALAGWIGGNPDAWSRFNTAVLTGQLHISPDLIAIDGGKIAAPDMTSDFMLLSEFNGRYDAALQNVSLHGGTGRATLVLDNNLAAAPIFSGSLSLSGVDALALTKSVSGFDWLSGKMDAEIGLTGAVGKTETLAEALEGKGRFSLSGGAIEGFDLPQIVAEAKQGEFGEWRREPDRRTPFDAFKGSFTVKDGVAKTDDLSLTGPNISVTGEGKTDLVRQKLNYRLKTKVTALHSEGEQSGGGAGQGSAETPSFAIPLIVKGDWDKPQILPDVENALKDTDSLVGTAKLFGKSVEKLTDGKVKAEDFRKTLDSLFGKKKKKKKKKHEAEEE